MIKDLQKILLQVHAPNEYQLSEVSTESSFILDMEYFKCKDERFRFKNS